MPWLLLGLVALIAIVGVLRWAAYADIRQIKRVLWLTAAAAGLALAVFLAISGRFAAALPFIIPIFFAWRRLPRMNRQNGPRQAPPPGASRGGMSIEEAREILGVDANATAPEITAAHRRLIAKLHPDHGGSNYLAAKLNEAKDLLLKNLKS
ncbi:MAG: hypothetical protein Tsb0016_03550 [Sphingomonadales bacterium]